MVTKKKKSQSTFRGEWEIIYKNKRSEKKINASLWKLYETYIYIYNMIEHKQKSAMW